MMNFLLRGFFFGSIDREAVRRLRFVDQLLLFELLCCILALSGAIFFIDFIAPRDSIFANFSMANILQDVAEAVPEDLQVTIDAKEGVLSHNQVAPYQVDMPFMAKWSGFMASGEQSSKVKFQMHFVDSHLDVPQRQQTWLSRKVALIVFSPHRVKFLHMALDLSSPQYLISQYTSYRYELHPGDAATFILSTVCPQSNFNGEPSRVFVCTHSSVSSVLAMLAHIHTYIHRNNILTTVFLFSMCFQCDFACIDLR